MVFHLQLGGADAAADPETAITYEKSFAFLFPSVKPFSFPGCKSLSPSDVGAMMIAYEKTFASLYRWVGFPLVEPAETPVCSGNRPANLVRKGPFAG